MANDRVQIRAAVLARVADLRSCVSDDECQRIADLLESWLPEWLGDDK
jgi:hypothetical protein